MSRSEHFTVDCAYGGRKEMNSLRCVSDASSAATRWVCVSIGGRQKHSEGCIPPRLMERGRGHLSAKVLKPNFAKVFRQAITRSTYQST